MNINFKALFPKSIFYRFVLMALLPMFITQTISLYVFFHRYFNRTAKQNIEILITEISILNNEYDKKINENYDSHYIVDNLNIFTDIKITFAKRDFVKNKDFVNHNFIFKNSIKQLQNKLNTLNVGGINIYKNANMFDIELEKNNGVLIFTVHKSRIFVQRFDLIIFWNIFPFFVTGYITLLFIKNQIRSINKLKNFANEFSYLEKDNNSFKPTGAKEIREMGIAFMNMTRKIKKILNTRTTMLAQISHDMRTPLTRMKLQTEFIEDEDISKFFKQDLEEMEKMINEYLLFTKGESENNYNKVEIKTFFNNILLDYKRSNYNNIKIIYDLLEKNMYIKVDSFKRCINNLINNSLKYCRKDIEITVKTTSTMLGVIIEDDGVGVPEGFFDKIKLAFYRQEGSEGDGFGLGLFIVKNIVNMHDGKIYFSKSDRFGGLSVKLDIPIVSYRDKKND
jgi:two-component system osmolarity sensor histidine kinase EnvZ